MEQNLDTNSSENFKTTTTTKRNLLWPVVILITIIAIGSIGCFIYLKKSPETIATSNQNAKISWKYNPSKLIFNLPQKNNNSTINIAAMCLNGTDCKDTINSKQENPSYYTCTSDKQCSFFNGFTGVKSKNEQPLNNVPGETRRAVSASNQKPGEGTTITEPALPKQSAGSSECFNKEELIKNALNKNELKEDLSIQCECGIKPPTNSVTASPSIINAETGETTPGTISNIKNKAEDLWVCMQPEARPDIMTDNFIFPQNIGVNEPFSISFNYKNVGTKECLESYFQADVTRKTDNKIENLGSIGAHLLYAIPLSPNKNESFVFGHQLLPKFDIAGDYQLDITMFCELPLETHMINGLKEIHIKVN